MARYLYSLACGPCTPLLHVAWGLGAPTLLLTSRRGRNGTGEPLGGAWPGLAGGSEALGRAWWVGSELEEPIETRGDGIEGKDNLQSRM